MPAALASLHTVLWATPILRAARLALGSSLSAAMMAARVSAGRLHAARRLAAKAGSARRRFMRARLAAR
jgi:hypothetical protein